MKHLGSIELESKRLILRKMCIQDAPMMFKNWTSDSRVTKYLTWSSHKDVEDTKAFVKMNLDDYKNTNFYSWVIVLKETMEPIGTIGLDYHEATRVKADYFEVGYCLGYDFWNQGMMSEVLSCVLDFMFHQVKAHRIIACYNVDNIASGKVMEKCGMKYEGMQREAGLTNKKQYCSLAYYSILNHEYENLDK